MTSKDRLIQKIPKHVARMYKDEDHEAKQQDQFLNEFAHELYREDTRFHIYKCLRDQIEWQDSKIIQMHARDFQEWTNLECHRYNNVRFREKLNAIICTFLQAEGYVYNIDPDYWKNSWKMCYLIDLSHAQKDPRTVLDDMVGYKYAEKLQEQKVQKETYIKETLDRLTVELASDEIRYKIFLLAKEASEEERPRADIGLWDLFEDYEIRYKSELYEKLDSVLHEVLLDEGYIVEKPEDLFRISW
jgi:hypothetical protein